MRSHPYRAWIPSLVVAVVLAFVALGLVVVLTRPGVLAQPTPASSTTSDASPNVELDLPASEDVPNSCPITVPGDSAFTPASETPHELSPSDDHVWYGTPELWTKIQPDEQVRNRSWLSPGSKTFWWSENFPGGKIEGFPSITVTAEHLGGLAPTAEGGPGTNGFHPDLGDFMLVGVRLPATGCWKLTAEYKGATLSYVMWVAP